MCFNSYRSKNILQNDSNIISNEVTLVYLWDPRVRDNKLIYSSHKYDKNHILYDSNQLHTQRVISLNARILDFEWNKGSVG